MVIEFVKQIILERYTVVVLDKDEKGTWLRC